MKIYRKRFLVVALTMISAISITACSSGMSEFVTTGSDGSKLESKNVEIGEVNSSDSFKGQTGKEGDDGINSSDNSFTSEMVKVTGGSFQMGMKLENANGSNIEPIHSVIVNDFYISKYPVTVAEFRQFVDATGYRTEAEKGNGGWIYSGIWKLGIWRMGSDASWKNPNYELEDNYPVTLISWNDAVQYCNWLSQEEGLTPVYSVTGTVVTLNTAATGYRLPTEAEWEYAAKGGIMAEGYTYAGSNIADDVMWYNGNGDNKSHEVGQKQANELGLYDMSGNVWEWCWDIYGDYEDTDQTNPIGALSGENRVRRGGCWGSPVKFGLSVYRDSSAQSNRGSNIGFRLVHN